MRCEVCGRIIDGKPRSVIIEGARMMVCSDCARLGSPYIEPERPSSILTSVHARSMVSAGKRRVPPKRSINSYDEGLDLVEGFGLKIRRAREAIGLSHEELGRRIGEKASVLSKVESEKIIPDRRLVAKLERFLKVKLLAPVEDYPLSMDMSPPDKRPTIGEVVQLKRGKRRSGEGEGINSS